MPVAAASPVFQSEGFIPKYPLPDPPHKNLSVRQSLRLAKEWGCRIERQSNGDFRVQHRLIELPTGGPEFVSISPGRNDVSQRLVSFLRRVREAVIEHPAYKASVPVRKLVGGTAPRLVGLDSAPTLSPAPEPLGEAPATATDQVPVSTVAPQIPPAPGQSSSVEFPDISDSIMHFHEIAAFMHYNSHATAGSFKTFHECSEPSCVQAQKHYNSLMDASMLGHKMASEIDHLLDEMTKPKQIPAPMILNRTAPAARTTQMFEAPKITESDSEETRQMKMSATREMFLELLWKNWTGGPRRGGLLDALEHVEKKMKWSADVQKAYLTGDFRSYYPMILGHVAPGNTRASVGQHVKADFERTLFIMRSKYRVQPESGGSEGGDSVTSQGSASGS